MAVAEYRPARWARRRCGSEPRRHRPPATTARTVCSSKVISGASGPTMMAWISVALRWPGSL